MNVEKKILNEIIKKGGFYGYAAKLYVTDSVLSKQFIIECSEQCYAKSAKEFWGEQLITQILNYKEKNTEPGTNY